MQMRQLTQTDPEDAQVVADLLQEFRLATLRASGNVFGYGCAVPDGTQRGQPDEAEAAPI